MNLKDGDVVTVDGAEMVVTEAPPDGYWLKEIGTGSYYYMFYKSRRDLEELFKDGRLKIGKPDNISGGDRPCSWHNWQKYVGIREVYEFCKNCGAKKPKGWRLIKDDREY